MCLLDTVASALKNLLRLGCNSVGLLWCGLGSFLERKMWTGRVFRVLYHFQRKVVIYAAVGVGEGLALNRRLFLNPGIV